MRLRAVLWVFSFLVIYMHLYARRRRKKTVGPKHLFLSASNSYSHSEYLGKGFKTGQEGYNYSKWLLQNMNLLNHQIL